MSCPTCGDSASCFTCELIRECEKLRKWQSDAVVPIIDFIGMLDAALTAAPEHYSKRIKELRELLKRAGLDLEMVS